MDLEADMKQSKRELTESLEREMKLAATLEALQERDSDLLEKLSVAKDEEKRLKDMISELQQEVKTCTRTELKLMELIKELKSRFTNENVPAKLIQNIKVINVIINSKISCKLYFIIDTLVYRILVISMKNI